MYRRIELINHNKKHPGGWWDEYEWEGKQYKEYDSGHYKSGIMGMQAEEVLDTWTDALRGATRGLPRNCRFYFTELGWDKVGRNVIKACIKNNQEYRVIAIKETDAQVVWRDKYTQYEVAIQPKRKK
jgi:hypothetical protein